MKELVFVSSVQGEFAAERRAIRDFVRGNRLLGKHFDVFIFEDLAAKDRRPDDEYLDKVAACAVFVALFGAEYGWEDPKDGMSPTEREFDRATQLRRKRLVFLKSLGNTKPHPKMNALVARARAEVVYKRFDDAAALTSLLYDSLIESLEESGAIHSKPFDAAPCPGASLAAIDDRTIRWFLPIARRERGLSLAASASKEETHASVQVSVFADRIEVWNPGSLPRGLRPEDLTKPHASEPANPLIARPLYLAHYIENLGTGTLDVIRLCRETGLPLPDFEQRGHQFVVTLWRDWLTADILAGLDLNDRQRRVVTHMKAAGEIGNTAYQSLLGVSKRTAHRDLTDLVEKGVLERRGATGKGVVYVLRKGAGMGPKGPSASTPTKGARKGSKGPATPGSTTEKGKP